MLQKNASTKKKKKKKRKKRNTLVSFAVSTDYSFKIIPSLPFFHI
jgi:hypothetical protein